MFARTSRRALQHDAFTNLSNISEGLHLPFLCPALFESRVRRRTTSSLPHARSRFGLRKNRVKAAQPNSLKSSPHNRNLASAVHLEPIADSDFFVPFESDFSTSRHHPKDASHSLATLQPFDPYTTPIVINDGLSESPKVFQKADGVSGDLNEIHQTLQACLQVGRLERARHHVQRLAQIYTRDAPGLLAAHTEYIKELSFRIVQTEDMRLLRDLEKWFQVDLLNFGIRPNEVIFAFMIRASLQAPDSRKARTVRRYLNLAQEAGYYDETMNVLADMGENAESIAVLCSDERRRTSVDATIEETTDTLKTAGLPDMAEVAKVKEVEQKGSGLLTLKKALAVFDVHGNASLSEEIRDGDHSPVGDDLVKRQCMLEASTLDAAIERWQAEDAQLKSIGVINGLSKPSIGAMMWDWHEKLVSSIKEEIRRSHEAEKKEKKSKAEEEHLLWSPYLESLSPEKLSAIAILATTKMASIGTEHQRGVRIHHIVHEIGENIQAESITEKIRSKKNKADWRNWRGSSSSFKKVHLNGRHAKYDRQAASRAFVDLEWGESTKIRIGAVLLSHIMDIAKVQVVRQDPKSGAQVSESQPVFFHTYQYILGKRVGVIRLHSTIMDQMSKAPVGAILAKHLPMVALPKPWVGFREGGFYEQQLPVVRISTSDKHSRSYAMIAAQNGDMSQVFAGLDVLAKTPWKINRFVFDVMLRAWNEGTAIAKIPPESPPGDDLPEPPPSDDPQVRKKWMRDTRLLENYRAGLKSQRCFINFQLEVARAYLNETFYFPHNCDFRGRAYPMAPFLNIMGADTVRGLFVFAKGKELTAGGLYWLKVHLANVYGYDKASFEDRVKFTDNHLSEIYDSVNKPLDGNRWWLEAADPWQCLAVCRELKNALDLPDHTQYVCALPIHQDGTCNGLQHYAALGGDVAGAEQVNLEPGEKPSDIYTGVAEIVKAEIAAEAAKGKAIAIALNGKITRKIVKQTVMTNVYGVTFTGAKRQVKKQLVELIPDLDKSFDDKAAAYNLAASDIARKIFKALSTMFTGAHDIQYWLTACATRICESLAPEQVAYIKRNSMGTRDPPKHFARKPLKAGGSNDYTKFKSTVVWTTPLKMPVVQPYRKQPIRDIGTNLQQISINNRSTADPVDKIKQVHGFPPNFIHSLDATHMFLTALKCHEVGLTFAAIHDSFWTHACDVSTMNRVIRDAFIRMHSEDIIGRLAAEFKARYRDYMHMASVPRKTRIASQIMQWRVQRRKTHPLKPQAGKTKKQKTGASDAQKWGELLLECQRLDLLASDDPKKREEGQNMETPASIFARAADEEVSALSEVKTATIGATYSTTPVSKSARAVKLKANEQLKVGDVENSSTVESDGNGNATVVTNAAELGLRDVEDEDQASTESLDTSENLDLQEEAMLGKEDEVEPDEEEQKIVTDGQPETAKKPRKDYSKVWLWLPLTFPPVPKKGEFDVTRLRESQYFFS